jgi:cellulose synthase/poly-beta-1,6-N-acetylglucosamine synthase-like glycosyltransferase
MRTAAFIAQAVLVGFALRRIALIVGSYFPRNDATPSHFPAVVVAIAARDEERNLPALFEALNRIDYPGQIFFSLVSDGSQDATGAMIEKWAQSRLNVHWLSQQAGGKIAALRLAIGNAPPAELICMMDADTVPHPDCIRLLAAALDDSSVAAAGGRCTPLNPADSIVARYSAVEFWVHHLINLSGKDRWNWNPIPPGALSLFRRSALEQSGGLRPEDDDVSIAMRLISAGYKTRYVVNSVVQTKVVTSFAQLVAQRRRWAASLNRSFPKIRSVEDAIVAFGYADRFLLLLCLVLAMAGYASIWTPLFYVAVTIAATVAAIAKSGHNVLPFLTAVGLVAPAEVLLSVPFLQPRALERWKPPGRETISS